jgi:glutathione peroxidase|tara:strand:+ start:4454 stop:4558 length:105 start_codon:yes stop_codon:yes gene_type:complete
MSFYDLSAKTIDGDDLPFSTFKGKPVLIVNVASK